MNELGSYDYLMHILRTDDVMTSVDGIAWHGSTLVALWRDGIAVDDDPGIPATVTLPGFAGYTVTGIDVLYGLEQSLVRETEGGDLVIRDLLVKDYPVILRIGNTRGAAP